MVWNNLAIDNRSGTNKAAQNTTVTVNNYVEDWEPVAITTRNAVNQKKLRDKYTHVFFYDDDADDDGNAEVRRIVNIEWRGLTKAEVKSGGSSSFQCVTVCVQRNEEQVEESNDKGIPYAINKILHDMIMQCPPPFNDAYKLVSK